MRDSNFESLVANEPAACKQILVSSAGLPIGITTNLQNKFPQQKGDYSLKVESQDQRFQIGATNQCWFFTSDPAQSWGRFIWGMFVLIKKTKFSYSSHRSKALCFLEVTEHRR
ncbi:MAG: hypothetical protein COT74_02880 [Bdellovibrionales bacterium CG10_big_fil_rev_8_21_14_0_10_45_34]|nr:MAG: hypothetical protein COT74_02880 [Bdellovibrionales bacterium CG10_big_fil_rev_8_21_14_0_10_45_34]